MADDNNLKNNAENDNSLFNMAKIKGIPIPLACRTTTYSDKWLLGTIFQDEEYNLPLQNFNPELILDCGANVGYASVYFTNKYPNAKIIAVEPERSNFKMLQYNTLFYDNITPVNSALWSSETYVKILPDAPGHTAGFTTIQTTADDPEALKTTTIARLLADSGFDEIDLLKVDIEGAEKEVFSENNLDAGGGVETVHDWLPKVKVLTIELHDRMKSGCSRAVFSAISKYDYYFTMRGENLVFIREDILN